MEWVRWYGAMLRSLLPASLRARLGGRASGLVVTADPAAPPERALVAQRSRGGSRPLGGLDGLGPNLPPAMRRDVTLALTGSNRLILSTVVTLPLAAERHLATAMAFELDRLTPFTAEEVWFRADMIRRYKDAGLIKLRLALLPRAHVSPLLDAMARAGLYPRAIEVSDATGHTRLPIDAGVQPSRRIDGVLAGLCAALAVVCLLIPLVRQQITLGRLAMQQAALAPDLRVAEHLRARLDQARSGEATLKAEQSREGDALASLAAITKALPDGSFLTDLSLRHRIATLDGESPDAAGLVAALSANPSFADPSFAAPVTRALNAKADIVSIRVRLRRHATN